MYLGCSSRSSYTFIFDTYYDTLIFWTYTRRYITQSLNMTWPRNDWYKSSSSPSTYTAWNINFFTEFSAPCNTTYEPIHKYTLIIHNKTTCDMFVEILLLQFIDVVLLQHLRTHTQYTQYTQKGRGHTRARACMSEDDDKWWGRDTDHSWSWIRGQMLGVFW